MHGKTRIDISFNQNYGFYGSKEHYCHFLWGFALPGLFIAIQKTRDLRNDYYFVLEDCGPIMNQVSEELFGLFGKKIVIEEREDLSKNPLSVPRWDIMSHYKSILGQDALSNNPHILRFKSSPLLQAVVSNPQFKSQFTAQIEFVRNWVINQISKNQTNNSIAPLATGITHQTSSAFAAKDLQNGLILKRSPEPEFYSNHGKAEIKRYGATRRSLVEIHEGTAALQARGHDISLYEPGANSLAHQIDVFNNCKGVIGIKGAEFSNLVWMRKQSKMVVITPDSMKTPPIYKNLGELLGIQFKEISGGNTNSPSLLKLIDKVEDSWNDQDRH